MNSLRNKILHGIAESEVKVGAEHFYRTTTLKEVLEWLDEGNAAPPFPSGDDDANRLVCGTGTDKDQKDYEVVRRVKAKEYRVEYLWPDSGFRKISLAEAAKMVQYPKLGQPGLSAFDKAYLKAQES